MPDLESRLRDELRREREAFEPSPDLAATIRRRVHRSRTQRVAMLSAAAGLLVVLAAGAVVLGAGGDDPDVVTQPPASAGGVGEDQSATTAAPQAESSTATTTTTPPLPATAGPATDLAIAGVAAPPPTRTSNDACGTATGFGAEMLVDGATDTAWRMVGDGTGQVITLDLGGPHQVTEVAIVPGYAKVDPCDGVDRFQQNRRPTQVTWRFDDGAEATQALEDVGELQVLTLPAPATSTTVELVIDGVNVHPPGAQFFDNTAISEVVVRGT